MTVCDTIGNCADLNSEVFTVVDSTPGPEAPWSQVKQIDKELSVYGMERGILKTFDNSDGSKEIIYTENEGYSSVQD